VLYGEKGPSVGASSTYPKASDIFGNAPHTLGYVVNILTLGLDPELFVQENPHPKKTLHKHLRTSKTHQIHKISCVNPLSCIIHPTTSTTQSSLPKLA